MGWYNSYFGIGTTSHAIGYTTFTLRTRFDRALLEALFRQNGVARKIITRMPFDATREGWTRYDGIDEDLSKVLAKEERRLRVGRVMTDALVYEREFGGAAVVLDVDDGLNPWEPLDASRVRQVRKLTARHRWELWPNTFRGGNYADPETYQVTPDDGSPTQVVHVSRMLLFPGESSSDQARIECWGWGDPVLETVWEEIRNVGISDSGVIEYLLQLSVPFLKVKKWWELIAGKDGKTAASTMLEEFRQRLSLFRLAVLDSEDDVQRLNAAVSGISEILEHQKSQVSAVTDYPQTLLYGRSPEGMNATGLSDLELYYGIVRAKCQEDRLRDPIEQLYSIMVHCPVWGGGAVTNPLPQEVRDQDPEIEFRPLWVPRELERAQVEGTRATARSTYAALGWIDPDEGRKLLEQDGILEPPSVDEFDTGEEPEPEEANPLTPPQEVSDAVSLGILRARRAGQSVPGWEESVARAIAGGRAITRSQATQLRIMLQDETEGLREYFGGDVTLEWLRSLSVVQAVAPAHAFAPTLPEV